MTTPEDRRIRTPEEVREIRERAERVIEESPRSMRSWPVCADDIPTLCDSHEALRDEVERLRRRPADCTAHIDPRCGCGRCEMERGPCPACGGSMMRCGAPDLDGDCKVSRALDEIDALRAVLTTDADDDLLACAIHAVGVIRDLRARVERLSVQLIGAVAREHLDAMTAERDALRSDLEALRAERDALREEVSAGAAGVKLGLRGMDLVEAENATLRTRLAAAEAVCEEVDADRRTGGGKRLSGAAIEKHDAWRTAAGKP